MAWAMVHSTRFPCPIYGESNVRSMHGGKSERVVKMKCSLQTPPMKTRTFSGLRGVNTLDNMVNRRHDFHSKVASATSDYGGRKAFRVVPSEKFTYEANWVIEHAQEEARLLGHNFVGTEMILLGLISVLNCIPAKVLQSMGIELKDARFQVESIIGRGSKVVSDGSRLSLEVPYTPRVQRVFELSLGEAKHTGYKAIKPHHLLLCLLREGGCVVSRVLRNLGAYPINIRSQVMKMVAEADSRSLFDNSVWTTLEEYTTELVDRSVRADDEEKLVGRQPEIERVIHILYRLTKNNPCLVGEHGVGKTSIVQSVAQKLCYRENNKSVISLDMPLLVLGEYEERLKKLIEEIKGDDETIFFIDGVHILSGARGAEGDIAAVKILRRALEKGDIQCIGATTPDEYRKYIETDQSLKELFLPVKVLEPTIDETIEILCWIREQFEDHYGVHYTDEALIAAVELSHHCISDRFLPAKAIDLIDEAGSRVSENHNIYNFQLQENLERMRELKPIELMEEKFDRLKELRSITKKEIRALPDQDLERAGMLRDQIIDHKLHIWTIEERIEETRKDKQRYSRAVTKADIQDTISSWDFY